MKFTVHIGVLATAVLLTAGCRAPQPAATQPRINPDETLTVIDPELKPEVLLFPEFLFMEGAELLEHGRIPGSTLVSAGMKTDESLKRIRGQILQGLGSERWAIEKQELGRSFFRFTALKKGAFLEVRAVQGEGSVWINILYQPTANR